MGRLLAFSVSSHLFKTLTAKSFITHLKSNISSRFASPPGNILLAFSIFDPRKACSVDSEDPSSYGETSITTLFEHYGAENQRRHNKVKSKVRNQ